MDNKFHRKAYLPEWYVLSDYDVICGRGRTCFYHEGNIRFRQLVETQLERYIETTTKTDKTVIIYEIIDYIRKSSPTSGAGFVKLDKATGRYFEVGDFVAREKTSQAFRDLLHEKYKSSNANKRSLRRVMKNKDKTDENNQDSPKNRSNEGNLKIDAPAMSGFDAMTPEVQNLFPISTKSIVEECNNFLSFHPIDHSSTMFDANSTKPQQINTGNIFDLTQQKVSSSLNIDSIDQCVQNLVEYNITDTLPKESNESSEGVWWDQKCERKATSWPNIHNANISDLSSSISHQRLVTPSLLRNKSFSHSTASSPSVDNKATIYTPSILGFPPAQVSNDIKTNVEHQIDPYIADLLVRNSFNFYNL